MSLYNRIEELCHEHKINITIMCKESGVSRGSLTDLKSGRSQGLSQETLAKIADYFDTSVDYLIGIEFKFKKPSDEGELKDVVTVNRNGNKKVYRFSDEKLAVIQSLLDQMQEDDSDL